MSQDRPTVDVMTIAKRDLEAGEVLDDFGGYTFHGVMDRFEAARAENALPVGLAPGAKLSVPKKIGDMITWDDVMLDETQTVVKLKT
ncbi:MAG: hypothetical protein K0B06_02915 [Brevefilum sp.]|nr:hypothetical protein [Brevefilum sp.]